MVMPSTVHTATESSTPTSAGTPRYCVALKQTKAPIMMTSPWAKLSILAMPYTME